ncbi:dipeptidase [Jannaschia seohaensis]|uniref:Membrane dipeptidase n=1 Tax=Jannaschia seohaensis TaxID=475081 RepID=A0A2Y9AXV0_9RHOB|nr:dipeptidase [Jannaschia seohaensis]PWJ16488.1 membrane dipeptidase [Jannaschia seohaensis]SSA48725.1 membrane dipeptidase [Jannaschia seohaensis]
MSVPAPIVFDGHNDLLTRLWQAGGTTALDQMVIGRAGAIDLPRAKTGGFGGGFFACWVPSPEDQPLEELHALMCQPSYDIPLPVPIAWDEGMRVLIGQAALLLEMDRRGLLRVCRSTAEIRAAMEAGVMAAIFHVEGAEAIDTDLDALDLLYAAGLRSIGPVWSRSTPFGHGVPFAFPSSPDRGPGLTEAGKRLVTRCNELGIMLDLSHLNEAGFWDVAKLSTKPLVATHSNAHALCPHSRNLTDAQLDAIAESDGMVGLNFAVSFLREDGRKIADTPIEDMLRHLDHLIGRLGEDRVGLGSDYDGAVVPEAVSDVSKLGVLRTAMAEHGYGEALIAKICHGNWLALLDRTWSD